MAKCVFCRTDVGSDHIKAAQGGYLAACVANIANHEEKLQGEVDQLKRRLDAALPHTRG